MSLNDGMPLSREASMRTASSSQSVSFGYGSQAYPTPLTGQRSSGLGMSLFAQPKGLDFTELVGLAKAWKFNHTHIRRHSTKQ